MNKQLWLFMGPPGCGKGTQASNLKAKGIAEHLSTGDLLRAAIKSGSELGKKVQSFVDGGSLVPDNVMLDVIVMSIEHLQRSLPLILDGYPRTLPQGQSLLSIVKDRSDLLSLSGVFWFEIDPALLIKRAVSRRTCSGCGAIYNIKFKPPIREEICDLCSGTLIQRKDDNEETILKRINVYNLETKPLLDFVAKSSRLISLDADRPENIIFEEIVSKLKK